MSRSKSSNKNMSKNTFRPYTVMCTDIYLLWILIAFPLYYADGYFHLPEKKATFWVVSTLVYIIVCAFGAVVTAFSMRESWTLENFKKNITMTDIFMFGFLISNLIALAMADNTMEAWYATGGRYYGARILVMVCLVYFLLSRYAWVNQLFIVAFLIGGNGVCLLATFDYFGMDVLGINKQMQTSDWLIFISTMGNANTCASYVTMALAGALCYFCVAKSIKAKAFAGISIMNCSMALITARSDSAYVGIAVIIVVLGILTFVKKIRWKTYIAALILVDMGILILLMLKGIFRDSLLKSYDAGVAGVLNQPQLLIAFLVALIIFIGMIEVIDRKKVKVKKSMTLLTGIIVGPAVIIAILCMIDKLGILQLFELAIGKEHVVASRIYIYRKVVQSYEQLPLINKIFGCGQATIRSVLTQYFGEVLSREGISINSAHNNVLDYLITIGAFGVVWYLGAIINTIKHGFKAFMKNEYAIVFIGCVIAYFAQGFFNIEQTNTTTIFWLLVACSEAAYRKSVMKKETF